MIEAHSLLSLPKGSEVAQLTIVDDVLCIEVVATAKGRAQPTDLGRDVRVLDGIDHMQAMQAAPLLHSWLAATLGS